MRSFRKIVVSIVLLCLIVMGIDKFTRYLYWSADNSIVYACRDMKETEGTVETLFLGTSLVHWGMDPQKMNELTGEVCFNLGTNLQPLFGSYYLLKDQISRNPIKKVFLSITIPGLNGDRGRGTATKIGTFDRLSSPLVKFEYLVEIAEPKEWEQLAFYPARVEDLFNRKLIEKNLEFKNSSDYKNKISPSSAPAEYMGMGFETTDELYNGKYKRKKLDPEFIWNRDSIRQDNLDYIRKIAALCDKNGIELNLIVFPMTKELAKLSGDFADMDAYMEEFSKELGANLFNYNYTAREDSYELFPNECYRDKKHFNRTGAAKFTEVLCKDYAALKEQ